MEKLKYFFDNYAIIEILKENKKYSNYTSEVVVLTIFNLAEIYWSALLDYEEDKANVIFNTYKKAVVEIDYNFLKEAIKFI